MTLAHIDLTVGPDGVKRLAQDARHFFVIAYGEGRRAKFGFAPQQPGLGGQSLDQAGQQGCQAPSQAHRIGAGGDVTQPLIVDLFVQDGGCSGAIARVLAHAPQHLPQEHSAHIIVVRRQRDDAPRDHAAVVQEFKLVQVLRHRTARQRPQGRRYRLRQR